MDVQHTRRWQNRDVAFLMDSALLKEKMGEGGRGGGVVMEGGGQGYCGKQGLYLIV